VLLLGPLLALLAGIALVATGINGSSSGAFYSDLYAGADPDLLAGHPQLIRTDEWYVQTVWAIAQDQQGLPLVNESFPGGMDATVPQDLPRADWSVAFRPHLWGFLALDVDHAIALKWWLPGLSLFAACYCFAVTLMPRRPMLALGLSAAFYLSPLLHWWYLQTTLWPPTWGFAVLTAVVWALRSGTRWAPIGWAGVVAYLTPVMAMGIYVPYIQPVALVVACASLGLLIEARRSGGPWRTVLRPVWTVLAAGAAGGAVVLVWLGGRRATIDAFLGTTYPGDRSFPTGQGGLSWFVWTFSAPFSRALQSGEWYGTNPSEASTFLLAGLFLLPVLVWLVVVRIRERQPLPWFSLGALAAVVIVLAFEFVPGWDAVARLLLLDQVLANRLRMGLGFASAVILVSLVSQLRKDRRPGWLTSLAGPVAYIVVALTIRTIVLSSGSDSLARAVGWKELTLATALALLLLARARAGLGVLLLVAVGAVTVYDVNPLYRGVLDLRETAVSRTVIALDDADPDAMWVGVGDRLTTAILLESGATGFNGFQGAPSPEMWSLVDPAGTFDSEWNRLAGVAWTPGPGDPVVSNPAPDQILVTFDGCSAFAQENVTYVLSDSSPAAAGLDQRCLQQVESFEVASGSLTIWEVTPAD